MARGLCLFTLLMLGLAAIAEACGSAGGDVMPDSPAAQATNVRRTAVAEVQRIIANNATATPQPPATPTPAPTCPNAIWWSEARSHLGESRTIQGKVVGLRPAPAGGSLLEIGQPYPDSTGLAVLLPAGSTPDLLGKTVCVNGKVSITKGVAIVQVPDATTIRVID